MHLVLSSVFRIYFALYTLLCHHELGASIGVTLSPLGTVSVCPGGQALLTCELVSGPFSFLYWDVSTPHPMATTRERIVTSQGVIQPEFKIGFTEFNITLSSDSPVISQLLISNVTTEINGSTVYCSDNRNESNAPRIAINVMHKDDALQSENYMVNLILRENNVTFTLRWSRETGAVYHIVVLPETSHTETISPNTNILSMTIPYNVQYNVTIVSSLCGITTTKIFSYADCGIPLMEKDVKLNYSSTVVGSVLILSCENETLNMDESEQTLHMTCHNNGSWIPDPAQFTSTCSPVTTVPPGLNNKSSGNILYKLLIVLLPSIIAFAAIVCILTLCALQVKKMKKAFKVEDPNQQPTYEEITQCHKDILLDENAAYSHITHAAKRS